MKTHISRPLLAFLFLWLNMFAVSATQYCRSLLTSGENSVYLTCEKTSDDVYTLTIEADNTVTLSGLGGSFCHINGSSDQNLELRTVQTVSNNTITCKIQSTSAPQFYTPLYVLMPGEVTFPFPSDIEWGTCGDTPDLPFDPTANLALGKTAVAGFGDNPTYANNGNYRDRWGSNGAAKDYSQDWWYVDLGNYYHLNKIEIYWENAYSSNFVIQGAKTLPADVADDNLWQTLYAFEGEPKHTNLPDKVEADAKNEYTVAGVARYVRIKSYKNSENNAYGMSMWEFRVFGIGVSEAGEIVPDMVSAKILSVDQLQGSVTLELKATKTKDGVTSDIHTFRLLNTLTGKVRFATTDDNYRVTFTDLTPCADYQVDVWAVDYVESDNAEHIEFEAPAGNMALRRECTAGFTEGENYAKNAVDGSSNTRWSSYDAPPGQAWWQVDLAEVRSIDSISVDYQANWVDGYEILTSLDNSSWSPLLVSDTPPALGRNCYAISAIGRYLRMQPKTGEKKRHNWSFYTFEVYGDCTYDDKPRMIFASFESATTSTAEIRVSATDAVTPFADLTYECILTQGENVYRFELSATDGILHLENMSACSEHTLEVWAVNQAGKKSDNSAMVRFSTECVEANLWLAGDMNGWNFKDDTYRFRKTGIEGIYSLTCRLAKGNHVYKLSAGSNTDCTKDDHWLMLSADTDVTFYARGVNNFASSADSLFVIGTAVSDAWTTPTDAKQCTWNGTQAVWTGNINLSGEYKIIKMFFVNGQDNDPYVFWSDLWETNQSISGVSSSSVKASFIFDLPTLSWSWQEVYEGQCTFAGKQGDGQTHVGSLFTTGYNVSLYLNSTKDSVWITAEFLDTDSTATSALLQNYPQRDETVEVQEKRLDRVDNSQVFKGKIPLSFFKNRADGIIRFGIKFEFDGGLRVTTPEFYYLDGSGCAERDFVIYHHDQMPDNAEYGAVYTFNGGRILQPILYKRKFRPDIWETLSLPFDVNRITVTDEDGEYELYAQYNNSGTTVEGNFWLRNFREEEVSAADFQQNWYDIEATAAAAALPKRNVPYIMRVPDDDTHYYADKYIVFHGVGYQTIDEVYSTIVRTPSETEMFAYSGNNTMKSWLLRSAYVLDDEGLYFRSGETVLLYPFECAVNAEKETTYTMPRLALNRKPATPTAHTPPTTAIESGSVWSVAGLCAGTFRNTGEYDTLLQSLPAGLYIVRQGAEAYKVYITR